MYMLLFYQKTKQLHFRFVSLKGEMALENYFFHDLFFFCVHILSLASILYPLHNSLYIPPLGCWGSFVEVVFPPSGNSVEILHTKI